MISAEKKQRLYELNHAMQTGVAAMMGAGRDNDTTPKHLRVGINAAMVDSASLAKLLISKGIITEEEYIDALIAGMEDEVARYTADLKEIYPNTDITLR